MHAASMCTLGFACCQGLQNLRRHMHARPARTRSQAHPDAFLPAARMSKCWPEWVRCFPFVAHPAKNAIVHTELPVRPGKDCGAPTTPWGSTSPRSAHEPINRGLRRAGDAACRPAPRRAHTPAAPPARARMRRCSAAASAASTRPTASTATLQRSCAGRALAGEAPCARAARAGVSPWVRPWSNPGQTPVRPWQARRPGVCLLPRVRMHAEPLQGRRERGRTSASASSAASAAAPNAPKRRGRLQAAASSTAAAAAAAAPTATRAKACTAPPPSLGTLTVAVAGS